MTTTVIRPESASARRAYRRAIREALSLDVPPATVAMVVQRFLGENPDPDVLWSALMAYVPVRMFMEDQAA